MSTPTAKISDLITKSPQYLLKSATIPIAFNGIKIPIVTGVNAPNALKVAQGEIPMIQYLIEQGKFDKYANSVDVDDAINSWNAISHLVTYRFN